MKWTMEGWGKIAQFFKKQPKLLPRQKNAKISTSKLNSKVQNIYIKPLLKSQTTYKKPCFETAYKGGKCK